MSDKKPEVKAGDPCPQCGGTFVPDPTQDPKTIVDRHSRNAPSPFVAARYAEAVQDKVDQFGVIHKCTVCGYQSRFKVADAETVAGDADAAAAGASAKSKPGSSARR